MVFLATVLLAGAICSRALGQSSQAANAVPPIQRPAYPNPYAQNRTGWNKQPSQNPNTLWSNSTDSNDNYEAAYSPARGPALPLAVRSPYTSAWTSTAGNGSLNSNNPIFWDGSALGWEGLVQVDGITYEWMGIGSQDLPALNNLRSAAPRTAAYDSQYSNFTLDAGPIRILASFFSPVIPTDYCRTSIPLSYLTVTATSTDGGEHDVSLYTDINGGWVTQPSAPLTWNIYENGVLVNASNVTNSSSSLYTWIVQLQTQYVFGENNGQASAQSGQGVFSQWGNFTWTSAQGNAQSIAFQSGQSINQRFQFINGVGLGDTNDMNYRSYDQQEPVFAFEHQLGMVGSSGCEPVTYTIGMVNTPLVEFLSAKGIESLPPWWSKCYGGLFDLISFHWDDYSTVQGLAAQQEEKLKNDIDAYYGLNGAVYSNGSASVPPAGLFVDGTNSTVTGTDQFGQQYVFDSTNAYGWLEPPNDCNSTGIAVPDVSEAQSYYAVVALAARQVMGAYALTVPSSAYSDQSEPWAFLKEIASSGNVNTVDVLFPILPFFLYINPNWVRLSLEPLYYNQESGYYPNDYSMHDLGSRFPNATGHVEGNDEYMPVEESGNMILMTYAIYKFTNNLSFLQQHYSILKQWASYLIQYSLVPAVQLSTDDFAGQLANQTNLAIKGIVGLAAMGEISAAVGDTANAQNYTSTSEQYYTNWTTFAIDPSGHHTLLAYQWRSSWGLLYNIFPAKLLNLSVIPQSLYDMQSAFYPSVSQLWGVPLDVRHYYTKSDWEMWTAATCQPSTRRLFVDSIAYMLNTTTSNLPFPDLYETVHEGEIVTSPDVIEFIARPVQGGLYSLLAMLAAGMPGGS